MHNSDIHGKIVDEICSLIGQDPVAYIDSFRKASEILKKLYPNGIKSKQYDDMLGIVGLIVRLLLENQPTRSDLKSE